MNSSTPRREFLKNVAASAGLGAGLLLSGCRVESRQPGGGQQQRRLRVAMSNAGLKTTWCALGKTTAELWAPLLGIDLVWIDGELDAGRQRNKIDLIVHEDWDFCCFQAVQTGPLEAPVQKLKKRGVPVISMDVELVPRQQMRSTGVWCHIGPDQEAMGRTSTRYLMEAIGGRGKVVHIGGLAAHSGAQGRRRGFEQVLRQYPQVEVVGGGVRWCDWDKEKALNAFQAIIAQHEEPIAGAFFHNDDMALACVPAVKGTVHEKMVFVGVDGQRHGLEGVQQGLLQATTVNPVCLIHFWALAIGRYLVTQEEKPEQVPLVITVPSPLVTRDNGMLEAMFYLAAPAHCLM